MGKSAFRVGLAAWAAGVMIGCSGSSGAGGPCAQRTGTYLVDFKTRSGNCGELSEQILMLSSEPTSVAAPCQGTLSYSADNCEVTLDETCPANPPSNIGGAAGSYAIEQKGTASWSHDGASGTALLEYVYTSPNGDAVCSGTYDQTYTRQ